MSFPLLRLIPIILITAALTPNATAATLNVPADYPTIQSCIDAAVSGQDECVVAAGTYNELINFLGKSITLRSSDGPEVTTIDGTGLNSSVVTCRSGETSNTMLEGFTITGGDGTMFVTYRGGGGILNLHTDPLIQNCVFVRNEADRGGGAYNQGSSPSFVGCSFRDNVALTGGGMYNYIGATKIDGCVFEGNYADYGGAVANYSTDAEAASSIFRSNRATLGGAIYNQVGSPMLSKCLFEDNIAFRGGAVYVFDAQLLINDSQFFENIAYSDNYAGGALYSALSAPTIRDCRFQSNQAVGYGGAISNIESNPVVIDSIFAVNKSSEGGAMYNDGCKTQIVNCLIDYNSSDFFGGGILIIHDKESLISNTRFRGNRASTGGGINNQYSGDTKINNCQFLGNTAAFGSGGGAIANYKASLKIRDSSFALNQAASPSDRGGGAIYNFEGIAHLSNCTWSENAIAFGDGSAIANLSNSTIALDGCIVQTSSDGNLLLWNDQSSTASVVYSNIQGSWPGEGNFDVPPSFLRPANPGTDQVWYSFDDDYGDLRLQRGSPCINAGDPNFVPQLDETDLDGHARVLCGRVDMGAYEFGIGDYDCDQTVNLTDLSAWPDCMTAPTASQSPIENSTISEPGARATGGLPLSLGDGRGEGDQQSATGIRQLGTACASFDFDGDSDVDLHDLAQLMLAVTVP